MSTQIWNPNLLRTDTEYGVEDNTVTITIGTKAAKGAEMVPLRELTFEGDKIAESVRTMVFLQGMSKKLGNKRAKTGVVWDESMLEELVENYTTEFQRLVDGTAFTRASSEGRALGSSDFLKAIRIFYQEAGKEFVQAEYEEKYGRTERAANEEQKQRRKEAAKNKKVAKILARLSAERGVDVEAATDDAV